MTVRQYFLPRSLPEAVSLLREQGPELMVMAGGTVAMPLINEGISLPESVMGLRLAGLGGIERADGMLRIGATTTLTQLLGQHEVPMLSDAARNTASWSVRNMATVGGNLFTPPPGGDVATALLALGAGVSLAGSEGRRVVQLDDFFTGFMTNQLAADELLAEIHVPIPSGPTAFLKYGRKQANTPAVVTVAVRLAWAGDRVSEARIALGAAGPHPIRARRAEAVVTGTALDASDAAVAADAAAEECEAFTDAIATAWYRRRMVGLFVRRALEQVALDSQREDR